MVVLILEMGLDSLSQYRIVIDEKNPAPQVFETRRGFDRDDHDRRWDRPSHFREDPGEIVMRSFSEVLGRAPSREEMRYYRSMILDRGWSERDIRRDLREDRNKGRW